MLTITDYMDKPIVEINKDPDYDPSTFMHIARLLDCDAKLFFNTPEVQTAIYESNR